MKKIIPFVLLLTTFLVSCKKNYSETTADNTVLVEKNFDIPDDWEAKFKDAKESKAEVTNSYSDNDANFKIECTRLYLDPKNSIIKSVKITLLKGAKNCEFKATVAPEQYNQQTGNNVGTFTTVSISFYKKDSSGTNYKSKTFVLQADGNIKES